MDRCISLTLTYDTLHFCPHLYLRVSYNAQNKVIFPLNIINQFIPLKRTQRTECKIGTVYLNVIHNDTSLRILSVLGATRVITQ